MQGVPEFFKADNGSFFLVGKENLFPFRNAFGNKIGQEFFFGGSGRRFYRINIVFRGKCFEQSRTRFGIQSVDEVMIHRVKAFVRMKFVKERIRNVDSFFGKKL